MLDPSEADVWPLRGHAACYHRGMAVDRDLPHHPFVAAVAGGLRQRCGVTGGARLVVAVSGGADSVALLRVLAILAPRRTWRLTLAVAHVQHHLRQRGAEADARLAAALAEQLELPFLRADLRPSRDATGNREAWARRERYRALVEMARAFDASFIVTAHHADDQLETMLMRLVRGCSVRGLAGMSWRRRLEVLSAEPANARPPSPIWLIRPMLAVDRRAARSFLAAASQNWREDHTNRDASRWRAALRQDVLPALRKLRPDVAPRATALGDHLRQAAQLIDAQIDRAADLVHWGECGRGTLDRLTARRLPKIVLAGLLRRLLTQCGAQPDRLSAGSLGAIVRAIRDTTGGLRGFHLSKGVRIVVERTTVNLSKTVKSD